MEERKENSNVPTKEEKRVFARISENYKSLNSKMVKEMQLLSEHDGITGNYREEMWLDFFRRIIPKKFSMAQGVLIIDSKGKVSKEVDIAVYDEQYTPYVFQYNTLKFIPIEAVVVAIECKSTDFKEEDLKDWADSIDKLETQASGIARLVNGYATNITNTTQCTTRPIKILASIKTNVKQSTINERAERLGDKFDFIIQQKDENLRTLVVMNKNEGKTLDWWGKRLTQVKNKGELENLIDTNLKIFGITKTKDNKDKRTFEDLAKEYEDYKECYPELKFNSNDLSLENTLSDLRIEGNDLLTLNFQLNQLLMLINNPMLFPHYAYAACFKNIVENLNEEE